MAPLASKLTCGLPEDEAGGQPAWSGAGNGSAGVEAEARPGADEGAGQSAWTGAGNGSAGVEEEARSGSEAADQTAVDEAGEPTAGDAPGDRAHGGAAADLSTAGAAGAAGGEAADQSAEGKADRATAVTRTAVPEAADQSAEGEADRETAVTGTAVPSKPARRWDLGLAAAVAALWHRSVGPAWQRTVGQAWERTVGQAWRRTIGRLGLSRLWQPGPGVREAADPGARTLALVTAMPVILVVAWLVPGLLLLLVHAFLPAPMVLISVPLAVALTILVARELPGRWPAPDAAGTADTRAPRIPRTARIPRAPRIPRRSARGYPRHRGYQRSACYRRPAVRREDAGPAVGSLVGAPRHRGGRGRVRRMAVDGELAAVHREPRPRRVRPVRLLDSRPRLVAHSHVRRGVRRRSPRPDLCQLRLRHSRRGAGSRPRVRPADRPGGRAVGARRVRRHRVEPADRRARDTRRRRAHRAPGRPSVGPGRRAAAGNHRAGDLHEPVRVQRHAGPDTAVRRPEPGGGLVLLAAPAHAGQPRRAGARSHGAGWHRVPAGASAGNRRRRGIAGRPQAAGHSLGGRFAGGRHLWPWRGNRA